MDRQTATELLDRLIGIDASLAQMEAIERQLRGCHDQVLRATGDNAHRHRRGLQVTIATIRQHLKYSA